MDQHPSRTATEVHEQVVATVLAATTAANLSNRAVAERAGIAHTTYLRRLSWGKPFNTDELARVAAVLEIDVATLLAPTTSAA